MKQWIVSFSIVMSVMLMSLSCTQSIAGMINSIDELTNEIELYGAEYTDEDWDKVNAQFTEITSAIEEREAEMTETEKDVYLRAIGRYSGVCAKVGLKSAASGLENFFNNLPSILDGFTGAFEGELENFESSIDSSAEKIGENFDSASEKLEKSLNVAAEKIGMELDAAAEEIERGLDAAAEEIEKEFGATAEEFEKELDAASEEMDKLLEESEGNSQTQI